MCFSLLGELPFKDRANSLTRLFRAILSGSARQDPISCVNRCSR